MIEHSKVYSVCTLYRPREWLRVDSNGTRGKPTFRRHANLSWLSAICIHFADIAAWSRKSLTMFMQKLTFLEKKTPYRQIFKNVSETIHSDIDPRLVCKFREIWPTRSLWNRALLTRQRISACSPALASARIAPKICQGQLQTIYSEYPKFHPKPCTSGRVIAGCVNIVETRHEVFPILGEDSLPSKYVLLNKHKKHIA